MGWESWEVVAVVRAVGDERVGRLVVGRGFCGFLVGKNISGWSLGQRSRAAESGLRGLTGAYGGGFTSRTGPFSTTWVLRQGRACRSPDGLGQDA